MDRRIQEMLDHFEIRKTLAEYCHACDRADEALMRSVYTGSDSFDDHGRVKAPGPEYARIMTGLIRERTEAISHVLGQSLIKVDGDKAGAETFFIAFMRLAGEGDAPPRMNQLIGRFVDLPSRPRTRTGGCRVRPRLDCRPARIEIGCPSLQGRPSPSGSGSSVRSRRSSSSPGGGTT